MEDAIRQEFVNNVVLLGERLSTAIETRWVEEVRHSQAFVPKDITQEQQIDFSRQFLEVMIDYLFGTAVAITSQYVSSDQEFEESVLALIRDKFARIRSIKGERKD